MLVWGLALAGCEDPELPEPEPIRLRYAGTSDGQVTGAAGAEVTLNVIVQSDFGLQSLRLTDNYQNDSLAIYQNRDSVRVVNFTAGTADNFPFQYLVPRLALPGTVIEALLILTDREARRDTLPFTINVTESALPTANIRGAVPDAFRAEPGQTATIPLRLGAAAILNELLVYEQTPDGEVLLSQIALNLERNELATLNFDFPFPVPQVPIGTEINLRCVATDLRGRPSNALNVRVLAQEAPAFFLGDTTINGQTVRLLTGRINQNLRLDPGQYLIRDTVVVERGNTLSFGQSFDQNVVIHGQSAEHGPVGVLVVEGNLDARGLVTTTATQPAVFTSDRVLYGQAPQPGDWGGIIIAGAAPEARNLQLQFLRIEYAGHGDQPALTLRNLLREGSTLERLQVYRSLRDGVFFEGGDIQIRRLFVLEAGGSAVRWQNWSGQGQEWLLMHLAAKSGTAELLGAGGGRPGIANLTILGPGAGQGDGEGIRAENAAAFNLYNLIVTGMGGAAIRLNATGLNLDNTPDGAITGDAVLAHARLWNNGTDYAADAAVFGANPDFANGSTPIADVGGSSFLPPVNGATSPYNPTALNAQYAPTNFFRTFTNYGGFRGNTSNNDWTRGWSRTE